MSPIIDPNDNANLAFSFHIWLANSRVELPSTETRDPYSSPTPSCSPCRLSVPPLSLVGQMLWGILASLPHVFEIIK